MKQTQIRLTVVGMQYRMTPQLRFELNEAAPFKIKVKRDTENSHDENAIAVFINQEGIPANPMQIGFIRAKVAALLAPEMDMGLLRISKARIIEVNIEDGTAEAEMWLEHSAKFPLDRIAKA